MGAVQDGDAYIYTSIYSLMPRAHLVALYFTGFLLPPCLRRSPLGWLASFFPPFLLYTPSYPIPFLGNVLQWPSGEEPVQRLECWERGTEKFLGFFCLWF